MIFFSEKIKRTVNVVPGSGGSSKKRQQQQQQQSSTESYASEESSSEAEMEEEDEEEEEEEHVERPTPSTEGIFSPFSQSTSKKPVSTLRKWLVVDVRFLTCFSVAVLIVGQQRFSYFGD